MTAGEQKIRIKDIRVGQRLFDIQTHKKMPLGDIASFLITSQLVKRLNTMAAEYFTFPIIDSQGKYQEVRFILKGES